MSFQTLARRVRNPELPLGLRYAALRSALEHYRRLGYWNAWEFITRTDGPGPTRLDADRMLNALQRLETSRNVWLAEIAAYAERRRAHKRDRIPVDRAEHQYRRGRRWPGPDAEAAVTGAVARAWRGHRDLRLPAPTKTLLEPIETALDPVVDAFLARRFTAHERRLLLTAVGDIEAAERELTAQSIWATTRWHAWTAELIRHHELPLVRRGWTGEAERITRIFWAARTQMTYLPDLYTFEQTQWWVANVMAPQSELWLAELNGVPVGFAALNGTWLDHLYLEPAHQGRGIGEALLAKAKRRRPELNLRVFEQNTGARAFYARQGFAEVGSGDGSDNEEHLPDLHLRWRR
ncbi:GNAT family N-acetyltransferase [Glycomyces tritici]|uniref:GNAT family N-acetyltransferase n=1 Tax=Glycomyces tritici TaxID=2665176 RepID=A0ABT7YLP5_9ACTN|nr:GNAT family N-acetyltransferase [Glycomyces tritici]MDN3239543.1 GNAT family N-acetyltransferase [Glycomyces tritici]